MLAYRLPAAGLVVQRAHQWHSVPSMNVRFVQAEPIHEGIRPLVGSLAALPERPANAVPSFLKSSDDDSGASDTNLPFEVDGVGSDALSTSQMLHWQDYVPNRALVEPAALSDSSPALPNPTVDSRPGSVTLALLVNETGTIDGVLVGDNSIDPTMFEQLLSVIRKWQYLPARENGEPKKARIVLEIVVEPPKADENRHVAPENDFGSDTQQ